MADTGISMRYTGDVMTPRFTPRAMPSGKTYQYSAGAIVQADPADVDVLRRLQFEEVKTVDDQQQHIPESAFETETNRESIEREQEAQRRLTEGVGPTEDPSAEEQDSEAQPSETPRDPDQETSEDDQGETEPKRRGRPRKENGD